MILKLCNEKWNKKKVIMWGIVFHKALCIYPKHSGGKSNNKIFTALKSWFYGGFKKREKLSKRRISYTGMIQWPQSPSRQIPVVRRLHIRRKR